MATYAVGDIQGCYDALKRLLAKVGFNAGADTLWVAGDLVNRGPDNLGTLRAIQALKDAAVVVLGNHDLHLLAAHAEVKKVSKKDTLADVLRAPECQKHIDWLRAQPLMHSDGSWVMSHAGIPHIWPVKDAKRYASEVAAALQSTNYREFLRHMYGNEPAVWHASLAGFERLRMITNYFTRMRFVRPDGGLDLHAKEGLDAAPAGAQAWFRYPREAADREYKFLFGHWAALSGRTFREDFIGLDTGCVWGGALTLYDLHRQEKISVPARAEPVTG